MLRCAKLPRRLAAERAVRLGFVVVDPPGLEDDPGIDQAAEEFPVQALVAQLFGKALDVPFSHGLPGVMWSVLIEARFIQSTMA